MGLLHHLLRLCAAVLFFVFGVNIALAVPMGTSEPTHFQTNPTHFMQLGDIGFAARAPPLAVADVEFTGAVTVMHGRAFAVHRQEAIPVLLDFGSDIDATNNVRPPVSNPTAQQLAVATDLGVDARWVRADGSIDWPPNNGFDGPPTITEIQPGTRFDRYGGSFDQNGQFVDTGGFVSPSGVPFDQRSLPASSANRPFQEYEVLQPIPNVNSGTAAPWFGQQGGGTQYELSEVVAEIQTSR